MKTLDIGEATETLAEYVRRAAGEPLIVTDNGTPVAAVLRVDESDVEAIALGQNAAFLDIVERSRAQWRAGQSLSGDEVRRELGLAG